MVVVVVVVREVWVIGWVVGLDEDIGWVKTNYLG